MTLHLAGLHNPRTVFLPPPRLPICYQPPPPSLSLFLPQGWERCHCSVEGRCRGDIHLLLPLLLLLLLPLLLPLLLLLLLLLLPLLLPLLLLFLSLLCLFLLLHLDPPSLSQSPLPPPPPPPSPPFHPNAPNDQTLRRTCSPRPMKLGREDIGSQTWNFLMTLRYR